MAEAIRRRRVKGLNKDGIVLVHYEVLEQNWLKRFKKGQGNLSTERVEKIEGVRNAVTVKELENWFVELSCIQGCNQTEQTERRVRSGSARWLACSVRLARWYDP